MEFISKLVSSMSFQEIEFPTLFADSKRENFTPRHTDPLYVGENLFLSIQGSGFHHSWPKATVDYSLYTSMEVAVVCGHELFPVSKITDNQILIVQFEKYYTGPVYSNVPVELIEKLYQDIKKNRGFIELPTR